MNELVHNKLPELIDLCRRFQVQRLELFGSAATDEFNPETSDLDFLVEFLPGAPGGFSKGYLGLYTALKDLFERSIDLVERGAIRNPYFKQSIEENQRVVIYGENREKAVV